MKRKLDETADEQILKRLALANMDGSHKLRKELVKREGPLLDSEGRFSPARVRRFAMMAGMIAPDPSDDEVTDRAVLLNFVKQHIHLFNAYYMEPEKSRVKPRKPRMP